jgi:tRNA A-37 threonylcarbamoyl transferase component Bud32
MIAEPLVAPSPEAQQIAFFREVLRDTRRIMTRQYGLRWVSIRPIGSDGSHLSMPVKITGVNRAGQRVWYFGKILGNHDVVSDRSMQFVKNLYLQMNEQDPIFGFTDTPEEMARQQFESLKAIYESGIPTAKPFGYHRITEGTWLLVAEFLEARPLSDRKTCSIEQIDTLFGYLKRLHSRGLFHGDIKPENIMLGDRIYILDTGVLRQDVDIAQRQAYDLACLLCTFLEYHPVKAVLQCARRYYPRQDFLRAVEYVDLVQQRQDFHFTNEQKNDLKRWMKDPPAPLPTGREAKSRTAAARPQALLRSRTSAMP